MAAFASSPILVTRRNISSSSVSARPRTVHMNAADGGGGGPSRVQYHGIQHCGFLVENTAKAKQFYMEVFGMEDDTHTRNPKLPFGGAFLRAGASQIHLMELNNPDPKEGRPEHGGRDKHVAITLQDLKPLIASLERHGRHYTFSKSGRRAVFTRDLDANALEFVEEER